MKIHKYGTVTFTTDNVLIEGWHVEREPEDPTEATDAQLLLGFAIHWAQGRFQTAINDASLDVFRKWAKQKQAEINAKIDGSTREIM